MANLHGFRKKFQQRLNVGIQAGSCGTPHRGNQQADQHTDRSGNNDVPTDSASQFRSLGSNCRVDIVQVEPAPHNPLPVGNTAQV